jgi:hypothetical protein
MALQDDLAKAASEALSAGATQARNEGKALAGDFEALVRPNLDDIVARIAAITAARIAGTINDELAQINLGQQFKRIQDLAIGEAELVLQAVQDILNAVIDALKTVINAATTHAIGFALV